jgi:acetylornithine deacetylase/succinyl-diaminopimelate desuccinylase-like protein
MSEPTPPTALDSFWQTSILPVLEDYIRIPNRSPAFDPDWKAQGHMDRAIRLVRDWCQTELQDLATVEILERDGATPLLWVETQAHPTLVDRPPVLLYGHLDKQPEFEGWRPGLGPWTPVLQGERLYGRGGADDGYAIFTIVAALRQLQAGGVPRPRLLTLIECSEESGSPDLAAYLDGLSDRLGVPGLIVCLDAECGNYEQLWYTTSLRGNLIAELHAETLTQGVHSGTAGGIVPSSFQVLRNLLDRIEDSRNGRIRLEAFHVTIPSDREAEIRQAARTLKHLVWERFPFAGTTCARSTDPEEALLENTWAPALEITGAEGLPSIRIGGNVLRPYTTLKLSFRLPPTLEVSRAVFALEEAMAAPAPFQAPLKLNVISAMPGWNAPATAPWLKKSLESSSRRHFGQTALAMGTGGSIPFMKMLADRYPQAQYFVTGVLGPESNAHGPNEFLHLPTAIRLTACLQELLMAYAGGSR